MNDVAIFLVKFRVTSARLHFHIIQNRSISDVILTFNFSSKIESSLSMMFIIRIVSIRM